MRNIYTKCMICGLACAISTASFGSVIVRADTPFMQLGLSQSKPTDQSVARDAYKGGQLVPYGRIKTHVQEQYKGRVVYQNLSPDSDGGWTYQLKVLKDDGHVLMVFVDAVSGEVLKTKGK